MLLPKDYIRYRSRATLATEPSDASATLMFDTAQPALERRDHDAVELPMHRCSLTSAASTEVLGTRHARDAATLTGLAAGTPVVGGGADNACGAVGVGVGGAGRGGGQLGHVGHGARADGASRWSIPRLRAHTFCHVAPRHLVRDGRDADGRRRVRLVPRELARELADENDADARLNEEAASMPRGAEGLTFLPYLQGERTPHRDASARGALLGLSLAHTRAHLTRAVLEGICFGLRDSLAILQSGSDCRRATAAHRRRRQERPSSGSCRPTSTACR